MHAYIHTYIYICIHTYIRVCIHLWVVVLSRVHYVCTYWLSCVSMHRWSCVQIHTVAVRTYVSARLSMLPNSDRTVTSRSPWQWPRPRVVGAVGKVQLFIRQGRRGKSGPYRLSSRVGSWNCWHHLKNGAREAWCRASHSCPECTSRAGQAPETRLFSGIKCVF